METTGLSAIPNILIVNKANRRHFWIKIHFTISLVFGISQQRLYASGWNQISATGNPPSFHYPFLGTWLHVMHYVDIARGILSYLVKKPLTLTYAIIPLTPSTDLQGDIKDELSFALASNPVALSNFSFTLLAHKKERNSSYVWNFLCMPSLLGWTNPQHLNLLSTFGELQSVINVAVLFCSVLWQAWPIFKIAPLEMEIHVMTDPPAIFQVCWKTTSKELSHHCLVDNSRNTCT